MRHCFVRSMLTLLALCLAAPSMLRAQATVPVAKASVGGQLSILERDNETTTDLGNAVVYLEPTLAAKSKLKEQRSLIALQNRSFQPRVRVVPVGSKVEFPNQDSFNHNVFSSSSNAEFDLGVYGKGESKDAKFRRAGVYPIYCNIHARMTGYVLAVATPYFTQPGIDGRFLIPAVPVGDYTMTVWHERAPSQTREVTVTEAGVEDLGVQLDARGYKRLAHKNKFGQEYKAGGDRY
jgi:plastocyanin